MPKEMRSERISLCRKLISDQPLKTRKDISVFLHIIANVSKLKDTYKRPYKLYGESPDVDFYMDAYQVGLPIAMLMKEINDGEMSWVNVK